MWAACVFAAISGAHVGITVPMSEVLSPIYEATSSWNARVVLGSKQR